MARDKEKLEKLQKELKTNSEVIAMDLGIEQNCINLYNQVKNQTIDILINNAGFGIFGEFTETNLEDVYKRQVF